MRVIYEQDNFRIIEEIDECFSLDDLKGETFDLKINSSIDEKTLKQQEILFEVNCQSLGVFGYILEKWNPQRGIGWEYIDSCYGFIGKYDENNKDCCHYIIDEMKQQIS